MTDLRAAAEMALEALEDAETNNDGEARWDLHRAATEALRTALAQPEQDHGFDRTASHMAGEYVDAIDTSKSYVDKTEKREHEYYVYREALEGLSSAVHDFKVHTNIYWGKAPSDAFVTLYAAPPRTGKPVAAVELIQIGSEQVIAVAWYDSNAFKVGTKLYTAPPSKQEPVAWEKSYDIACALLRQAHDILGMTQHPIKRPWVSLTDEEIITIRADAISNMSVDFQNTLCRAIEAALRSKNDPTSN